MLHDEFDADQYCHSPLFEKCCGEKRTVKQLKDAGVWDDIWFKMIPRKTINYPTPSTATLSPPVPPDSFDGTVAPTQIQVEHHDFDTVGIKLLLNPVYPVNFPGKSVQEGGFAPPDSFVDELKIMVLMKV